MKAEIIRIGNSQGIRLPKAIIQQCGFGDTVDLEVQEGRLVISAVRHVREGWDEAFKSMAEIGDDAPLMDDNIQNEWDRTEWRW